MVLFKQPVFRKNSPNGKLSGFVKQREYTCTAARNDPIEGVVLIDPSYVGRQSVYVSLKAVFRYGINEDDEAKIGRSQYYGLQEIFPPEPVVTVTEVQKNLVKKLGPNSYPFTIEIPHFCAPNMQFQEGYLEEAPLILIKYYVFVYVAFPGGERDAVSIVEIPVVLMQDLDPVLYENPAPKKEVSRVVFSCSGTIRVQASLDQFIYRAGELVGLKIFVENNSTTDIKTVKAKLIQLSTIPTFFSKNRDVVCSKIEEPWLVLPGSCSTRSLSLKAEPHKDPAEGKLFLEATLHGQNTGYLASTTVFPPTVTKENVWGAIVSYAVRVKVVLGMLYGELTLDIPFVLARQPREQPIQEE